MGLGFYTYFAARGVPLVLLAFCGYLLLAARPLLWRQWRGIVLMFAVAAVLTLPLLITLNRQPQSEARVAEVAVPLVEARAGNFEPLRQHVVAALNMFHSTGDPEWLYNIPGRPVFGAVGAVFFWIGVAIALWRAFPWKQGSGGAAEQRGRGEVDRSSTAHPLLATCHLPPAYAFLLLWWLGGIAPAFFSVPPASLGHTILAQSAVYLLAAVPVGELWAAVGKRWRDGKSVWGHIVPLLAAVVLLAAVAARDLPDYFVEWPGRGLVRFLYRADVKEVADYLNTADPPLLDFGITSLLAGPWDRIALEIDLKPQTEARPRWYNPERVALLRPSVSFTGYPVVNTPYATWYTTLPEDARLGGDYVLSELRAEAQPEVEATTTVCFNNGLCLLEARYEAAAGKLELLWQVERELDLPPLPLISNPPPPGVYAGPRLLVFAQLQDEGGNFLVGDDGLWVDPLTLRPGDLFLQRHQLMANASSEAAAVVFGLYDPFDERRVLTADGQDHLQLLIER
jgi:hypothetical protein